MVLGLVIVLLSTFKDMMQLIFFLLLRLAHNDLWLIVQVHIVKTCSKYVLCLLVHLESWKLHPTRPAFSYPQPPSI